MSLDSLGHHRKPLLTLQLAPMIDVFVLIIIFLLKSTVLGGISIVIPSDMKAAQTKSKEVMEASPHVLIFNNEVEVPFLQKKFPIEKFTNQDKEFVDSLKKSLSVYIGTASNKSKNTIINLNIVADARTSYKDVFDVIKVFRESGLQSMLFIAEGEMQ